MASHTILNGRVIILGAGPAGYTAAIYAARANLNPWLITGTQTGGQLMTTTTVENWPGGVDGLTGPDLMESMQQQVTRLGVKVVHDHIQAVRLQQTPFLLTGESEQQYTADALIIATGASAKYLGIPSEAAFKGKGVSACATCDGFLYRNQTVAVVGGGNTALEEALYLSNIASKTILIHRRDTFRAEKVLQTRLFNKVREGRIELQLETVIHEIKGDAMGVTAVQLQSVSTKTLTTIPVRCLFVAIGHQPNTDLFANQLALQSGYLVLPNATANVKGKTVTSISGVFAAGDVADPIYRQAVTASASGCMAALDAEQYLDSLEST